VKGKLPFRRSWVSTLTSPSRIPFNLWRADHWYNKPLKKKTRPSKEDYKYYFTHNVSVTSSGNFSTKVLKFCIDELGVDRCMYSIGMSPRLPNHRRWQERLLMPYLDYPYDTIESAQEWWAGVDLPEEQKTAVARGNAIRLFKLPLEP
jgi:2,3-dihydroxybenzoate decarboxylase